MIRDFEKADLVTVMDLLEANDLPIACLPDLTIETPEGKQEPNPLFVVKRVMEHEGRTAMMCFLKVRSELYFFIDHRVGTPEQRWQWLKEFTEDMKYEACKKGLDQMTAFVPNDIDESFGKRLEELGFIRSKWVPYSLNLE
jgi:hypothetical protein